MKLIQLAAAKVFALPPHPSHPDYSLFQTVNEQTKRGPGCTRETSLVMASSPNNTRDALHLGQGVAPSCVKPSAVRGAEFGCQTLFSASVYEHEPAWPGTLARMGCQRDGRCCLLRQRHGAEHYCSN